MSEDQARAVDESGAQRDPPAEVADLQKWRRDFHAHCNATLAELQAMIGALEALSTPSPVPPAHASREARPSVPAAQPVEALSSNGETDRAHNPDADDEDPQSRLANLKRQLAERLTRSTPETADQAEN